MNQQCHLKAFVLQSLPWPSCSREQWQDEVRQAKSCFIYHYCALTHTYAVNDSSQTKFLSDISFLCLHVSFFYLVSNSFYTLLQRQLHSVLNNIYYELIKGFGIIFFSCLKRKSGSSQLVKCWGSVRCFWFLSG